MNILFALAHPDDEAFGPCCTIRRLVDEGHAVTVAAMCNGARPGAEHVARHRQAAFQQSCSILGASSMIHNNADLTMSYPDVVKYACSLIDAVKPDVVYTTNLSDVNMDHRLLADGCMVACRPKPESSVRELYFCEIPGSTDWGFGQLTPQYSPNVYVDISEWISVKQQVIGLYSTEQYEYPDARSIEAAITSVKRHGTIIGVPYAEAFKLVFARR